MRLRRFRAQFLLLGALVAWLAPTEARAQRGIDSELFRPALDSYGIFTVERAQTSHQWDWGFKLYVDYAQNPLRLNICTPDGTCPTLTGASLAKPPLSPIITYQAVMHFGFHLGLTDWLEFVTDI